MGVSLILLRRARTGIALSRCGWVCVYAPMWPGTSFLGYPFLDLRPEKWVGRWMGGGLEGEEEGVFKSGQTKVACRNTYLHDSTRKHTFVVKEEKTFNTQDASLITEYAFNDQHIAAELSNRT